jgi:hypothetical protein
MATLAVLVDFNGANGAYPTGALAMDAEGDRLGVTGISNTYPEGTLFETGGAERRLCQHCHDAR